MIKQNLKTLIIEPDSDAAKSLRDVFERFGFRVDLVPDTNSALETIRQGEFDLVTIDCLLPDQNGISCLELVKAELSRAEHMTKIIAAAPEFTPEIRRKCTASGVNGIIAKPFSLIPVAETLFTLN